MNNSEIFNLMNEIIIFNNYYIKKSILYVILL